MSLAGQTILITGAAGGLGSALALRCAQLGADLVLLDKNRRGLGELSDQITHLDLPPPGLYPLDLAGAGIDDFNDLIEILQSEFGGLQALVHCAVDFESLQPFEQIAPQEWLRSIQVNVNAPWLLSCACLPLLKTSGSGRLFFMLDDLDTVMDAYWGAYGTGKAALAAMVRQFDATLSNTPVKVRGINPGPMRTAFRAKIYHAENPMEQPDPAIVAERIANLLAADSLDETLVLDFSD